MTVQGQVTDLMKEWVAAATVGAPIPPEELCKDVPELLPQLRERVERFLSRAAARKSPRPEPPTDDAEPETDRTEIQRPGSIDFFAPPAFDYPRELGGYKLSQVLGEGGMGRVYLAEDPLLRRRVAVKVMRPDVAAVPDHRRRFLHEARSTAELEHDHIVAIHQVGEEREVPFLVMPLLQGEPLDRYLRRAGRLAIGEAIRIARQTAEGLACAHRKGLIHRDIKPANVWLEGDRRRVKILDFGLAKACRKGGDQLTQEGVVVGTPSYMAPEQARGIEVDFRADLFSLGCVLYEMVTGERAFDGPDTLSILTSLALDRPRPARSRNPSCPQELSDLIDRLMAKLPDERPASAQILADSLARLETEPPRPSSPTLRAAVEENLWAAIDAESGDTEILPRPKSGTVAAVASPRTNRKPLLVGVSVGLAVVLLAWIFLSDRKKPALAEAPTEEPKVKVDPPPVAAASRTPVRRNSTAVIDSDDPEFQSWLTKVAGLSGEPQVAAVLKKMKELNPGFDGASKSYPHGEPRPARVEAGIVREVGFFSDGVHDLAPLRALRGIRNFWCVGSKLTDVSPLRGLELTALSLACNPALSDLTPLKGMPLTRLDLANTNVGDLSPLRGIALTSLAIQFTPVADLSPLQGMPLEYLNLLGSTRVKNLAPLAGLPLKQLYVRELGGVTDLKPLAGMPLVVLDCSRTSISELDPIRDAKLTNLSMFGTRVADLSPLRGMPLEAIEAGGAPFEDLSPLRGMKIARLEIPRTGVTDLSDLAGMPLQLLDLSETRVTDLTPLRGAPLASLRITGCKEILDFEVLKTLPLETLHGDFRPDRDAKLLRSIKTLKQVNGVPVADFLGDAGKK